jgi:hypothetical protein
MNRPTKISIVSEGKRRSMDLNETIPGALTASVIIQYYQYDYAYQ